MSAPTLARLKKRRDFLRVAGAGKKFVLRSMVIQYTRCPAASGISVSDTQPITLGFTVTKKQGNAVMRNRIRRRLKEAARHVFPDYGKAGTDYVIIGRRTVLDRDFEQLQEDMRFALGHIHKKCSPKPAQKDTDDVA